MAPEIIKCPYCDFKFKTDVKALEKDGETIVIRLSAYHLKPEPKRIKTIDLECPNCKKTFEYKVKS